MNSFDQDDILLEIKRKKSASADVKPAGENAAPAAQTKTAAKSGSQDEEWDLLWQSVSTKQKKPQLFDYDAEEKRAAAAEIPVPEAPAAPAAVAVEEPAPEIPAKRKTNFEINIPDLDDEPAAPVKEPEEPVIARRASFKEVLPEASAEEKPAQEEEDVLAARRRSRVEAFVSGKRFELDEEPDHQPVEELPAEVPAPVQEPEEEEVPVQEAPRRSRRAKKEEPAEDAPLTAEELREEIRSTRSGILIRLSISLVCFLLIFYLHLVKVHMLMAPQFLWPEYYPLTFIAVNFGLLLITVLANSSIVGGGLISLFTFKPDTDSLTSLSVIACVVQAAVLTMMPKHVMDPATHLYQFIPALALVFANIGRLMYINRVDRGSRIVSGNYDKYAILKVDDTALARELTRGLDMDDPAVAVSVKAKELVDFEDYAYSNDFSENLSRVLAPICLLASAAVSAAGYFLSEDPNLFAALTAFSALTAVCSPLTASIAASMPLARMSKKLHKDGAMIAGYDGADELSDVSAVVLSASDLFTPKDVTLFSVKPFAEKRIDEALLDAASLVCSTESTLSGIFSNIIQGQKNLLRPVENIVYEDGMGLSAWVNKKRVLIGNRALMQHYGVDTPSKDFEAKYCRDHRDILYLANSGELSAMFVLGYSANEDVEDMLEDLEDQNIALVVSTNDPNVNAEKICRLYDFPMEDIRIVPAQAREALLEYQAERETAPAQAAHMGTAASLVSTVCASYSTRTAVILATMIQFIGVILGYAVLALFVFTGAISQLNPDLIAVYMLIWAVLVMLIPRLRKI